MAGRSSAYWTSLPDTDSDSRGASIKKSDIEGREIAVSGECYADQNGKPYRITRQLRNLIDSVNKNSDTIFTKKMNSYVLKCNRYDRTLRLHELRREYIVRHVL